MFLTNEELSTIAKGDIVTTNTVARYKVRKVTQRYIRATLLDDVPLPREASFRRTDGLRLPDRKTDNVYIMKVERAAHASTN